MIKKIAIILGAFLWGVIVFRVALGIHFPAEELGKRIRAEFEQSTNAEMQMDINALSLAGLVGLEASQTTIYKKDKDNQSVPYLFIDSLAVVLNPFQAITGSLGAHISSAFMNGTVEGDISGDSFNPQQITTDWTISDLALELLPIASEDFTANVEGKLSSTFTLDTPVAEYHKNANGMLRVDISNFAIKDAKAQGISLPDLIFSEAKLLGKIKNGKISLDGTSLISESLGINISGNIVLAKKLGRSRIRLVLDITLGKEFDLISKMVPELKQNKQPDGSYKLNLVGTLNNPRIRTDKGKSKKGNNNRKRNKNKSVDAEKDAKRPKLSPEEKRKQRRERMERRKKEREERKKREAEEAGEDIDEDMEDDFPAEKITRPNMSRSRVQDLSFPSRFEEEEGDEEEEILEEEVFEEEDEEIEDEEEE